MKKFIYRQTTGDIIIQDTLEVIKLNSVAKIIFELYQKNKSVDAIAFHLAEQFKVDLIQVKIDVLETLNDLKKAGIVPSKNTAFQLHTVIMHVIQNCNSPCRLCDCWKTKNKTQHSLAELKPTIEWLKNSANNQNIMVSGGEPLLHEEIQDIVAAIKATGMKVLLNTNGLLLPRHPWITSNTVDEVVISMDGFDSDSYKKMRGIDGYTRVWQNIRALKNADPNLTISLRLILNKGNIDQLFAMIKNAEQNGIQRIGISPLDLNSLSFGRINITPDEKEKMQSRFLPSLEQIQSLRDYLKASPEAESLLQNGICDWESSDLVRCLDYYQSLHFDQIFNFNSEPCFFPMSSLVIDYDGGLKPCFYGKAISNLREPAKYAERFEVGMTQMAESGECKNCRGKVFCDVQI